MSNHYSQAHLDMVYDGPALADGSMIVRDSATAINRELEILFRGYASVSKGRMISLG